MPYVPLTKCRSVVLREVSIVRLRPEIPTYMTLHLRSPRQSLAAGAAALGIALFAGRRVEAAELRLLVFLHVAQKQRALQSELQAALPALVVTAVGRLADFERGLRDGQDAVLTLPLVMSAFGMNPQVQGRSAGSPEEKYSLVSSGAAVDPARVTAVGALDILGRDATTSFVHGLLGARPRVERVTKVEDLLPLLQMQRVDAVLLPSRLVAEVQTASRLSLTQRELASQVKLPALASVGGGGSQAISLVSRLPLKVSKTLGVDEWR